MHQLWANQLLLEFGVCNRVISGSIYSSSTTDAPKPYHYLAFEDPDTTETHDYTWRDLKWRPASSKSILSGTFVQFQEVINADEICTVNVKANTALLQAISIAPGLPCLTTTDFNPSNNFLWISADESGSTAGPNNIIYRVPIPGDPSDVPWETNTAPWNDYNVHDNNTTAIIDHVHADRSAGYIFFRDTASFYLYRTDLDGGNLTTSTTTFDGMGIDRVNQRVYVYNFTTQAVEQYDYNLNLQSSFYAKPTLTNNVGGLAVDQTGTNIIVMEQDVGVANTDNIYTIAISDSTKTEIANISSLGISAFGEIRSHIDETQGLLVFASGNVVYSTPYPSGGSITTVLSLLATRLCALIRIGRRFYMPTVTVMYIR